jgi:hypothetical protein
VLLVLLVDLVHLDCHLPVFVHCKDASNLPLVVLLTKLGEVFSKKFVVASKLNDLILTWWIWNLVWGLRWNMHIIRRGEKWKRQRVLCPLCVKGLNCVTWRK